MAKDPARGSAMAGIPWLELGFFVIHERLHTSFVGNDELGVSGNSGREVGWQTQSLVEGVGVERLSSSKDGGQSLISNEYVNKKSGSKVRKMKVTSKVVRMTLL